MQVNQEDSPPEIYVTWSDPRMTDFKNVIEHWLKAKVAEFSNARLEFSLLYLPHTFDSLYTLPH